MLILTIGPLFLGIVLCAAALIETTIVSGFCAEFSRGILGLYGGAVVYKKSSGIDGYDEIALKLAAVPRVRHVAPLVEGQVLVSSQVSSLTAMVRGTTEDSIKALRLISENVITGTLNGFDRQDTIAVGSGLAATLGVALGDTVSLASVLGSSTASDTVHTHLYNIAAIFETRVAELDRVLVVMPLSKSKRHFARGDKIDRFEVTLEDPEVTHADVRALQQSSGPALRVMTWRQRNPLFCAKSCECLTAR